MKKILVLEDDLDMKDVIVDYLSQYDYELESVVNGLEGIQCYSESPPDLVIMDILMDEEDGFGFLLSCLTDNFEIPFKVIAISGGGTIAAEELIDYANHLGVDASFKKPFSLETLHEKVTELLS